MKNSEMVITVTSVAAVVALVLDAIMFLQHGHSLLASNVWPRLALFIVLPYTRLVHAFSAPFHYLFRPYIVYRSRDDSSRPSATASRASTV